MLKTIKSLSLTTTLVMGMGALAPEAAKVKPLDHVPAQAYMQRQLSRNDLVLFGTTHKQPPILCLITDLLPALTGLGVTHLALEISSDQQARLDQLCSGKLGADDIVLHTAIDCPAYRRLLGAVQNLPREKQPILAAIDLPTARYDGVISRDEWMARQLGALWRQNPQAKVLVVLGSLHVLHKLNWQHHLTRRHAALRSYLERLQPNLKMHSVVNIIGGLENDDDFARRLGPRSTPVGLEVDKRFAAWQLGLTRCIAIKPTRPHELTDGIIVY